MKNDRYLKVVLTVIALCLLWICIKEISIMPKLYAGTPSSKPGTMDVNIVDSNPYALTYASPMEVTVGNPEAIAAHLAALLQNK
jgi:hypothetical protein